MTSAVYRVKVNQHNSIFSSRTPLTIKNQIGTIVTQLSDIPDIAETNLANGAIIIYNSNTLTYEIRPIPVGNGVSFSNQIFINAGSTLSLNSTGLFVNNNLILSSLAITGNLTANVITTTANSGLVAQSNGSAMVYSTIDEGVF